MLNRMQGIGHLGQDVELKYTKNGDAICNISVALKETWNDSQGQKQSRTEWVTVIAYKKMAENCSRFLYKGSLIYFEGKLATRSWDDKEGKKCYKTEVWATDVRFLTSKEEPSPKPPQAQPQYKQQDFADDLPF